MVEITSLVKVIGFFHCSQFLAVKSKPVSRPVRAAAGDQP